MTLELFNTLVWLLLIGVIGLGLPVLHCLYFATERLAKRLKTRRSDNE